MNVQKTFAPPRRHRVQLLNPVARVALGVVAATVALWFGIFLFGPVSDERVAQLVGVYQPAPSTFGAVDAALIDAVRALAAESSACTGRDKASSQ